MTHKVGPKGQVVIPKEIRDQLGIRPGDRVSFWCDGDAVSVRRVDDIRSLAGCLPSDPDLAVELLAERRADREREDAREAAFGALLADDQPAGRTA
ncbi:AbrB/MazE/SpoVT family DNA-binding domain-containing protein [Candidatus Poriferisodalis sp.]|uniref:AbrB/MazE/SpoVT family DNA-binding domain-containing protein n=1 Tax=Candidatus Poriferisodalis sp. TaxID=3101277 RepID=UPI003B51A846